MNLLPHFHVRLKMSVQFCRSLRCHITEGKKLYIYRCENTECKNTNLERTRNSQPSVQVFPSVLGPGPTDVTSRERLATLSLKSVNCIDLYGA
jgi:hypothetical protein